MRKTTASFLRICVRPSDLAGDWSVVEKRKYFLLRSNKGQILLQKWQPYPVTFAQKKSFGVLFGYIDPNCLGVINTVSNYKELRHEIGRLRQQSAEFLIGVIRPHSSSFELYRDVHCNLPLFFYHKRAVFLADNHFENIVTHPEFKVEINEPILGAFLAGITYYTNETVFSHLKILTERSALALKPTSRVSLRLPRSAQPTRTRRRSNLASFAKVLGKTVRKRSQAVTKFAKVGVELSGGLDSSTVAGIVSTNLQNPLQCYSIEFLGDGATTLRRKLLRLVERFPLKSHLVKLGNRYPLIKQAKVMRPKFYKSEIYENIIAKLAQMAKAHGVEVIFTGIGGDELFSIDQGERNNFRGEAYLSKAASKPLPAFCTEKCPQAVQELATSPTPFPLPLLPHSVHGAHLATNNIFILKGVWPIAPLAEPKLVRYCRGLPKEYRFKKEILRRYQATKNYPVEVFRPVVNENFQQIFDEAFNVKAADFLRKLFERSILGRLGWLDKQKLVREYEAIRKGTSMLDPFMLYRVAAIEIILQSLEKSNP